MKRRKLGRQAEYLFSAYDALAECTTVYKITYAALRNKAAFLNNLRKYILKKYVYTINHKRIAINYFFFSM